MDSDLAFGNQLFSGKKQNHHNSPNDNQENDNSRYGSPNVHFFFSLLDS
jgi:hypothetical protein